MTARYDGDIPGWGGLARNDKLILGDFDGDGRCDVFIFNGDDWSMPYLGMFRSAGSGLAYVHRFDGDVPGWGGLARHDQFFAADIDGNGRCDLWAWNHQDWSTEYLGRMISSGTEPVGELRRRLGRRVEPRPGRRVRGRAVQRQDRVSPASTSTTPTGSA